VHRRARPPRLTEAADTAAVLAAAQQALSTTIGDAVVGTTCSTVPISSAWSPPRTTFARRQRSQPATPWMRGIPWSPNQTASAKRSWDERANCRATSACEAANRFTPNSPTATIRRRSEERLSSAIIRGVIDCNMNALTVEPAGPSWSAVVTTVTGAGVAAIMLRKFSSSKGFLQTIMIDLIMQVTSASVKGHAIIHHDRFQFAHPG